MPSKDATTRFSNRVADYVRYRPTYPAGVLDVLRDETVLTSKSVIADVGSGTGISSKLFLDHGNTVFAVEPNAEMRQAAETWLAGYPTFHSIAATAEATTLQDSSIDHVVAGQAFHWFDRAQAAAEFARILRPGGWVVLLWNNRRVDSSSFLREYEALLQKYGTDYHEINHRNVDADVLRQFFAQGQFKLRRVYNEQRLDFDGIRGRLMSSSYVPSAGEPQFPPMLDDLAAIFQRHATEDRVVVEYDTEVYFGHVG